MSTEKWEELKAKQEIRWANFMAMAQSEQKKLETAKAKLLEPYGGKNYDAPEAIQKMITNMDAKFNADYLIGGRLEKLVHEEHAKQDANFIRMQGITAGIGHELNKEKEH